MQNSRNMSPNPNYQIDVENIYASDAVDSARITQMTTWILESENQAEPWSLTFIFVDDAFIKDLNERFFNKPTATDVISFNMTENDQEPEGEVYISVDTARDNAQDYSVSLQNELLRLVAHGTYHILGYDDVTGPQKEKMTLLENKALEYVSTTL